MVLQQGWQVLATDRSHWICARARGCMGNERAAHSADSRESRLVPVTEYLVVSGARQTALVDIGPIEPKALA